MKIIIKGGKVVDPANNINGDYDILVKDGIIEEVAKPGKIKADTTNAQEINAKGLHVFPGLVDAHCHLREPGFEYKEDIVSGTKSAAAGGFTSVACMPNTNPVIDNEAIVKYIINKAKKKGHANVFPIGAISKGMEGKELSNIGELKEAGVVAISDDGRPVVSSSLMKKAILYSGMFNIRVISHCEDLDIAEDGDVNEGEFSTRMGLIGIPAPAEEIMVSRELILSEYTGVPIHIAHISTELSVDLIRNAKRRGVKVTCETCPHYFSLTEEDVGEYNTNAKMNPPLRTQKDVEAIIAGIKDGTIDMIATDHAPQHKDEKNVEFGYAANGIVGFETALSVAIKYLVEPGHINMSDLARLMSEAPAKMLGINKGTLSVGADADITIIDSNKFVVVNVKKFISKSKNSPYDGFELKGLVSYTILGGKIYVY